MLGKYQKNKILIRKSKNPITLSNQKVNADKQLNSENNINMKKYILKLRNKIKYNLLTFFNSKK
jgi:hypothetical protein